MPEEIIALENAIDEKADCCCRTKVRSEKEQKDLKAIMGDRIAENESGIWYMTVVMQGKTKLQTAEQLILKGADGQLTLWEIAD